MDQARAEDEGEQPEDDDQQDLNHRDQNEQDDVDRDRKLKGVNQIEVGEGLVVQVQNIGTCITFIEDSIVSKVYIGLGNSLDILSLLIIIDVDLDDRGETFGELVRVKSHWQQLITTIVNQSFVSRFFRL